MVYNGGLVKQVLVQPNARAQHETLTEVKASAMQ
jgi:hypothetical protein